jgi:acetylornithine deacetylase/succinyl-diaminopimelate desuccinylase-like protein
MNAVTRPLALAHAAARFDSGEFFATLARRVAIRSESQGGSDATLTPYLSGEIAPALAAMGFASRLVANPIEGAPSFLVAQRHESDQLPTVLMYGHGDVVKGYDDQWRAGLSPWALTADGERWYGRGAADNKGQHSINLAALASVLAARGGRLGFNVKLLLEMGEEVGSPGLNEACTALKDELKADLFLASDGPRLTARAPTVFLGSRGLVNFELTYRAREGGHHSGNWGGLLRNPATTLVAALSALVDGRGVIQVEGLRPPPVPAAVREALASLRVGGAPGDPEIDPAWGEAGLTPEERVFAWNSLELLAMKSGNPENPVNAIPPWAQAWCQLRFVVGTEWERLADHVRAHLDARGFQMVEVQVSAASPATRLDPDDPWVRWAVQSIQRSTGKDVAVLPNLGGTLPNDAFAETLGLPTVWVPHSYPACSQHAPNEHLLAPVVREALQLMAGLYWDLGEGFPPGTRRRT